MIATALDISLKQVQSDRQVLVLSTFDGRGKVSQAYLPGVRPYWENDEAVGMV